MYIDDGHTENSKKTIWKVVLTTTTAPKRQCQFCSFWDNTCQFSSDYKIPRTEAYVSLTQKRETFQLQGGL